MSQRKRFSLGLVTYDKDKSDNLKQILKDITKLDKSVSDSQEGQYDLIMRLCIKEKSRFIDPDKLNKDNYSNRVLEGFWLELGFINVDSDGCIEEDWRNFDLGTYVKDIWKWFDQQHSKGIKYLMYGVE